MIDTYVAVDDDLCAARFVRRTPAVFPSAGLTTNPAPGQTMVRWIADTSGSDGEQARRRTRDVVEAALAWAPAARMLLHAEPGLRGHLWQEYAAVSDVAYPGRSPVLLLVPAVPADGHRIKAGVQFLTGEFDFLPASMSPFASHPDLGYDTARLLDYADARSQGRLSADRGTSVGLRQLLDHGSDAVVDALERAAEVQVPKAGSDPAGSVVVVDALTDEHLQLIARGLQHAWRSDVPVVPRISAPLAAMVADRYDPHPSRLDKERVLVVIDGAAESGAEQLDELASRQVEIADCRFDLSPYVLGGHDAVLTHGTRAAAHVLRALMRQSDVSSLTAIGHLSGGAVAWQLDPVGVVVACLPHDIGGRMALVAGLDGLRAPSAVSQSSR